MLILNINGPINSGKSTVSKILVNMLPKAAFIEVDELMSDEEQERLGLSLQQGWRERHKRLRQKLQALKKSREYETVIFAFYTNRCMLIMNTTLREPSVKLTETMWFTMIYAGNNI